MASSNISGFLFVMVIASVFASPVDVEEEPAFECTGLNEAYFKCDLTECYKVCEHLTKPPACPSIASGCYKPACLCTNGYLRNQNGDCVPYQECPGYS